MKLWQIRCHPWACRWIVKGEVKNGCPATLEDYRSKGTKGILFPTISPKVSWEVYLSLQIRWCFRSCRTPEVFWITYDAAAGNVLAMTGHGSPRMFKGFNDLRWCRNEIFMVLFLQSSLLTQKTSKYLHMQHWAHEQEFSALSSWKVSGLGFFGYHFEDQNALLDVWGVEAYTSNIPKNPEVLWFNFWNTHQNRFTTMKTLTKNHPFVYPVGCYQVSDFAGNTSTWSLWATVRKLIPMKGWTDSQLKFTMETSNPGDPPLKPPRK